MKKKFEIRHVKWQTDVKNIMHRVYQERESFKENKNYRETLLRNRMRQLKFCGHFAWKAGLESLTFTGIIEDKRNNGKWWVSYVRRFLQMDEGIGIVKKKRGRKRKIFISAKTGSCGESLFPMSWRSMIHRKRERKRVRDVCISSLLQFISNVT